jgi:hypothetical protein
MMPRSPAHLAVAAFALVFLPGGDGGRAGDAAPLASAASVLPTHDIDADTAPRVLPSLAADLAPSFDPDWSTGPDVGTGVAMKDTRNQRGNSAFIGYAGYGVALDDTETWVDALYDAWLRERGVRYVWAVRGPDDSHYEHKEIGNTKIGARLRAIARAASFVLVAAHSSGSCVAHELFEQLADGRDSEGATAGKIVYFNLDGIEEGLTTAGATRLRRAYFVGAADRTTGTLSPNAGEMRRTAERYAASVTGGFLEHDASGARCASGASWCVHVSLVTNAPHDPRMARPHLDYTEFASAGVATAFFDANADEWATARR